MSCAENLHAAMRQAGPDYDRPVMADGRLDRLTAVGDRNCNWWFVLHASPPGEGAFGCWKRAMKVTGAERNTHFTPSQRHAVCHRRREAETTREQAERDERAENQPGVTQPTTGNALQRAQRPS
jgi:hypothetical protein